MKNLFLSTIFAVVAFASNSQVVTITGFGLSTTFGSIKPANAFTDILLDTASYLPYYGLPNGYKYVVDFDAKQFSLFNGDGVFIAGGKFKILNKKSDRDFQIAFDGSVEDDRDGIIVKNNAAAYFSDNGLACHMYVFESLYIY